MSSKKRRRYDSSFKLEALRLADDPDKSDAEVERELGLFGGAMLRWGCARQTAPAYPVNSGEHHMLGGKCKLGEYRNPAPEGRHRIARWRQPLALDRTTHSASPGGGDTGSLASHGHSHRYFSLYSKSCFFRNEMNSSLKVIVL